MCKILQISVQKPYLYKNIDYVLKAADLYQKYSKYLADDYTKLANLENIFKYLEKLQGGFWIVVDENDNFAGFAVLENWTGDAKGFHSAEITTCFDRNYWGNFTKVCAKQFIKYCFETYGLKKLKAVIFPDNVRVLKLLKSCGFKKEAVLVSETMRRGKPQDVVIYSIMPEQLRN